MSAPAATLVLLEAPEGIRVELPDGGRSMQLDPLQSLIVGLAPGRDHVQVLPEPDEVLLELLHSRGWGGRRNFSVSYHPENGWFVTHLGHGGDVIVNEAPMSETKRRLESGDQISPCRGLTFRFEHGTVVSPNVAGEPPALLDAVADAPDDLSRWHVLADWLLEHEVPHALLAAYELKLRDGTNAPEVLGDYAEARRVRHRLGLGWDRRIEHPRWKCGYLVGCGVGLEACTDDAVLARIFGSPQLSAFSQLELHWRGAEQPLATLLRRMMAACPPSTRTVTLRAYQGVLPLDALRELARRPLRAKRLSLHLGEPTGSLTELITTLVDAGWATLDFEGTNLSSRVEELRAVVAARPEVRFGLSGTWLDSAAMEQLSLPNVVWFLPEHDAFVVDTSSGTLFPLSRTRTNFEWPGLTTATFTGWTEVGSERVLVDGDRFTRGQRTYEFFTGPELSSRYQALLAAKRPAAQS